MTHECYASNVTPCQCCVVANHERKAVARALDDLDREVKFLREMVERYRTEADKQHQRVLLMRAASWLGDRA